MIRLAFCDDEKYYLKSMSELAEKELIDMKLEYDIETFEDGSTFLRDYDKEEESFDLIFLDIDMKGIDGITLAKRIREMDNQVVIVFLTMMEDRVYDTFGYNAFRFIKKTQEKEQMVKLFRECIKQASILAHTYLFNTPEGIVKVRESEIVYFERNLRKFYMHTIKGQYRIIVEKFGQILNTLGNSHCFQWPNRSTLINMRYVDEITKNDQIILGYANKREVHVLSRGRKKIFYDSFIAYIK